jgi:hypothetical protein
VDKTAAAPGGASDVAGHPVTLTAAPAIPLAGPLDRPPSRRSGSVRRTSSLDMTWPAGPGSKMRLTGRARDLKTDGDGSAVVLADDCMRAEIGALRTVDQIEVEPLRPGVGRLVGATAGRGFRAAIDTAVPDDRSRHTPLALLLDDIAGASLIGGFAWSRQEGEWANAWKERLLGDGGDGGDGAGRAVARRPMIGICSGFRPGSSALQPDGTPIDGGRAVVAVPSLVDPADPDGWHPLETMTGVAMRRARRMDVWSEGGAFRVDAHFRDCCTDARLGISAVHEYSLDATIDPEDLCVTELIAIPRALPFQECPLAASNVAWLVGQELTELRSRVVEILHGIDCCTHLNDALRALADVSALLPAVDVADHRLDSPPMS